VRRLLLIAFFLEIGFALIVVPWSAFWDRNYFASTIPLVGDVITNDFVRGAISGVGLINVATGIAELASLFMARGQNPQVGDAASVREE
jgi:ABC-type transport system involved in cytochrome c biogenesis permease subunit